MKHIVLAIALLTVLPATVHASENPLYGDLPPVQSPLYGLDCLIALISSFNNVPEPWRTRVMNNRHAIAETARQGELQYDVPAPLLLAVGWMESHLGTADGSGGNWGAPIDMQHRHTAGPPLHAARALASSYRACGSWVGAIGRFRSGDCRARGRERYVRNVVALVRRIYVGIGRPISAEFDEGMIRENLDRGLRARR